MPSQPVCSAVPLPADRRPPPSWKSRPPLASRRYPSWRNSPPRGQYRPEVPFVFDPPREFLAGTEFRVLLEEEMPLRYLYCILLAVLGLLSLPVALATVLAGVRGVVHDPQHRPIPGATVTLHAANSDFVENETTNTAGEFSFSPVPPGVYIISAAQPGFDTAKETVTVVSNTSPVLHFELQVASVQQSVTVTTATSEANVDSVTPTTMIARED